MSEKTKEEKKLLEPELEEQTDPIMGELEALARIVAPCFQCTTCASACPVFQSDSQRNPRRIIYRLCTRDFVDILDEVDFWWCGSCYSCEVHCPQGVPLTRVFYRLKNLAFHSGKPIPGQIIKAGGALRTGFLFTVRDGIKEKRRGLGLPDLVPPDVQEIESILSATGFRELIKKSR